MVPFWTDTNYESRYTFALPGVRKMFNAAGVCRSLGGTTLEARNAAIFRRDGWTCQTCPTISADYSAEYRRYSVARATGAATYSPLQCGHIVPWAQGGLQGRHIYQERNTDTGLLAWAIPAAASVATWESYGIAPGDAALMLTEGYRYCAERDPNNLWAQCRRCNEAARQGLLPEWLLDESLTKIIARNRAAGLYPDYRNLISACAPRMARSHSWQYRELLAPLAVR